MDDFKEEVYTWDYVMEQKAKADWDAIQQGDPTPYACLPKLNIFTYNLGSLYPEYADIAFNFREFFRVDEYGNFIHGSSVKQFLNILKKEDKDSNYPYSTQEYREIFRHSLWMIPGVKEARALSKLLQEPPIFSQFGIINVAGDGDEEVDSKDALPAVEKAMGKHPEETYTITLSCGRLTTGVSVKPWTACFMLSGTYSTAASTYMQTIFRVQTPAIIGFEGSKMLEQLKKVYVERVVRNVNFLKQTILLWLLNLNKNMKILMEHKLFLILIFWVQNVAKILCQWNL